MALNTPYKRASTAIDTRVNADPWYNLGALLGTIWGERYNQRGIEKSADTLRQSLPTVDQEVTAAAEKALQPQGFEEFLNNRSLDANAIAARNNPHADVAGAKEKALQSVMGNYDLAAPANGLGQAQQAALNFDIDAWQAEQIANLQKQGRTPAQIEAAMQITLPYAQKIQRQQAETATAKALEQIAGVDLTSGFNPQTYQLIHTLAKTNPTLATMLAKDMISPKEQYQEQNRNKRQEQSFKNQLGVLDYKSELERDNKRWEDDYTVDRLRKLGINDSEIATYLKNGGTGKGQTKERSPLETPEFKYAEKRIAELEATVKRNEQQESELRYYRTVVNDGVQKAYGLDQDGDNSTAANPTKFNLNDDYILGKQVNEAYEDLKNKGFSDDEITQIILNEYGDNENIRKMLVSQGRMSN